MGDKKDVLTLKDIKQEFGLSRSTVLRRVDAGHLHPLPKKPGYERRYRLEFSREEIERLLAQGPADAEP